jgi:hypothetical protein
MMENWDLTMKNGGFFRMAPRKMLEKIVISTKKGLETVI